jgi:CRP/FNR family cyclic AMP-dependent transcriptional regulator
MTSAELHEVPLFASLPPAALDEVRRLAVVRSYPKRTIVASEHDPGERLYVILSGSVSIYMSDEKGRQIELDQAGPGDFFGVMIFDGGPHSASTVTLEKTRLAVFSRADFQGLMEQYPVIAMGLIHKLIRRLRVATGNIRSLGLLNVYDRIVELLLEEFAGEGSMPGAGLKVTHQEIANRVGASREMVGRILRDLARGGYISVTGGHIRLLKKPPSGW